MTPNIERENPCFYWKWMFITVFIAACHLTITWITWNPSHRHNLLSYNTF